MTNRKNVIRDTFQDRMILIFIYAVLVLVLVTVLYPLLNIVAKSFSSTQAVIAGRVGMIPVDFSFYAYEVVFRSKEIWRGYGNTIFYTFFGTLLNVGLTVMIAYPLSRREFSGKTLLMIFLVFTMFFDGGLIPTYLVIRDLGILNTRWALILPSALAVWQVIIARTFFRTTIPEELYEAGQMEGCRDVGFLLRVVLPLSKPVIAVMILMYAVGHWNAYFQALIYLNKPELYPLQLVLRNILILNQWSTGMQGRITQQMERQHLAELLKYALIVVASLPVLLLYPMIQKYFVQGMMIGSLKG